MTVKDLCFIFVAEPNNLIGPHFEGCAVIAWYESQRKWHNRECTESHGIACQRTGLNCKQLTNYYKRIY